MTNIKMSYKNESNDSKKEKKVVETFEIIAAVIKRKTYKLKLQQ